MFRSIFRPYGLVWRILNDITDVLGLSLLWCVCSLPLVTMGAATTALYDAAVHGIRYREAGMYHRFLRTFKKELKTGVLVSVLWGIALIFCFFMLAALKIIAQEDTKMAVMAGFYRVLTLLPMGAACWSCAILSRFDLRFRELTVTALRFVAVHPLSTAAIAILAWLAGWFCLHYLLPFAFAPAVTVLAWSWLAERVFAKYGGGIQVEKPEEE